jgi:lysine-specific demethylase 3
MYCAHASGSGGSTCLHLDMSDAVNVLTYASETPDGKDGYATWHIFVEADTDLLRCYMRKAFGVPQTEDPIHSQAYYLGQKHL